MSMDENEKLEETSPATPAYDEDGLYNQLAQIGIKWIRHVHPAVNTVEEALYHTHHIEGFNIKNLFLRDKKRKFYLITLEHQRQVDLKQIGKEIGASGNLSFADSSRLYEILGVRPGSVTPFGLINDLNRNVTFYLDKHAPEDDGLINAHPLRSDRTAQIKGKDLRHFIQSLGYVIHSI